MVHAIRKEVAPTLVERVVLIEEDLGWVSPTELLYRIEPAVLSYKRKYEMDAVETMLGDSRNVVLGVDETLVQLQQGENSAFSRRRASKETCNSALFVPGRTARQTLLARHAAGSGSTSRYQMYCRN